MINKKLLFIFTSVFLFSIFGLLKIAMAADGSGTCALSPSQVVETNKVTITFTFTAAETMDRGSITITIPSGWSAPQASSGTLGYTVGSSTGTIGSLSFSGQVITVPITALTNTETITVVYGSGGGASGALTPPAVGRGGSYTISVSAKSSAGGALTIISSLPKIEVVARPEVDATAPVTTLTSPIAGETINQTSYTITGAAIDSGGSTPAWVKLGIGNVWYEAKSTGQNYSTWEYEWVNIVEGTYLIQTKSGDWNGNNEVAGDGILVTVDFSADEEIQPDPEPDPEPESESESESESSKEQFKNQLRTQIIAIQKQILALLLKLIELYQGVSF